MMFDLMKLEIRGQLNSDNETSTTITSIRTSILPTSNPFRNLGPEQTSTMTLRNWNTPVSHSYPYLKTTTIPKVAVGKSRFPSHAVYDDDDDL